MSRKENEIPVPALNRRAAEESVETGAVRDNGSVYKKRARLDLLGEASYSGNS